MLLAVDNLAHRYHCLPSEALSRATTFDLRVLNISAKWSKHQHEELSSGNSANAIPKPKKLTQDEMKAMIERVRKQENERKSK